jgi:NAD+ diphosphatase
MSTKHYCEICGTELIEKYLESEGHTIPYCPSCSDFRFPHFSCAVSMIVTDQFKDKVVLIRQYGGDKYILVAGYVNKGEDAEETCRRELNEELGLQADSVSFNHSHYFAPSNTLMLNFTVTVKNTEIHANTEIDSYTWMTFSEAEKAIRKESLAQDFLEGYLHQEWHFHEKQLQPYTHETV